MASIKWQPIYRAPCEEGTKISAGWFETDDATGRPLMIELLIYRDGGWRSTRCAWRVCHHLPVWSPQSHLGALTDRPAPTSGKIIPGKSRRIERK